MKSSLRSPRLQTLKAAEHFTPKALFPSSIQPLQKAQHSATFDILLFFSQTAAFSKPASGFRVQSKTNQTAEIEAREAKRHLGCSFSAAVVTNA